MDNQDEKNNDLSVIANHYFKPKVYYINCSNVNWNYEDMPKYLQFKFIDSIIRQFDISSEQKKLIRNLTISNNQVIKKIDNFEALENQYIKIKELLGKSLEVNIINTKEFDRDELKDLFLSKKIYRVDSKIIISDEHVKQLVEIVGFMPDEFSVKDFKDKSNLSRKYAIPYLELLDKIGVTQKINKAGSRKKL